MATGESVHWIRVNDVADYVDFDHSVHVGNGPRTVASEPAFKLDGRSCAVCPDALILAPGVVLRGLR